jgi:hypothetical protein
MTMKDHILAALREQFERWEELLASLSDEQIMAPQFDDNWSIKDVITHLWGWQQIFMSQMTAAILNREPEFSHIRSISKNCLPGYRSMGVGRLSNEYDTRLIL